MTSHENEIELFENWLIDNKETSPYPNGTLLNDSNGQYWKVIQFQDPRHIWNRRYIY